MRLSKLSIRKLKKYISFLREYYCDIVIHYAPHQTVFLEDIDSVPFNKATSIEVWNYINCETVQTFKSVNAFLICFSILRRNPFDLHLHCAIFDPCGDKNISVKSLN